MKPGEYNTNPDRIIGSRLVLITDDNSSSRQQLGQFIGNMGHRVLFAENGEACLRIMQENPVDILLLSINMPKKDSLKVISFMTGQNMKMPVIMVTVSNEIPLAVRCIKMGTYEHLTKPLDIERLNIVFRNAVAETVLQKEVQQLKSELRTKELFCHIVGRSPSLRKAMEQAMQVMETELNVLLLGESGTGKELFAHAIHLGSKRKQGPFVSINCAAICSELSDSLLFGHKKGAFTGAISDHSGYFEQADGGTIFLDEIGDMNSEIQAKVLRVLQERKIRRVGEKTERNVDIRIISATNHNFSTAIQNGTFREDLYYRLEEFPISIPPLRERRADIPMLASYFLDQFCSTNNLGPMQVSDIALLDVADYTWPGNVRELKNAVQRAAVTATGPFIEKLALSLQTPRPSSEKPEPAPAVHEVPDHTPVRLKEKRNENDATVTMDELEEEAVRKAFYKHKGNAIRAASSLGISRATFYRKLKKYDIKAPDADYAY